MKTHGLQLGGAERQYVRIQNLAAIVTLPVSSYDLLTKCLLECPKYNEGGGTGQSSADGRMQP